MDQRSDASPGYDWETPSLPPSALPSSAPFGLPDHAADDHSVATDLPPAPPWGSDGSATGTDGPGQRDSDGPPTEGTPVAGDAVARTGFPAWATVAIVVSVIAGIVALAMVLIYGVTTFTGGSFDTYGSSGMSGVDEYDDGTVTTQDGTVVSDGTGQYDTPATPGEHTFTWRTWDEGTVSLTAAALDDAATLPAAGGVDVIQDGYRLVVVDVEVLYEGTGTYLVGDDLWPSADTSLTYHEDIAEGLLATPMSAVDPLADGETATFQLAFIVSEAELASLRVGLETSNGFPLYYGIE